MAGTVSGGKLAGQTNKQKYGEDFYQRIGAMGGKRGKTGGFYADPGKAAKLGAQGGKLSKRGHKYLSSDELNHYYRRLSDNEIVKFAR